MITKEEVLRIAKLARLELAEKEVVKMQKDLSSILDYFSVLKKAKIQKTAKKNSDAKKESNVRKDVALEKPASLANNVVALAPDKKDNYIKVKAIL